MFGIEYLKQRRVSAGPLKSVRFAVFHFWQWTMMLPKKDVSHPIYRIKCPVIFLYVCMYEFPLQGLLETILVQTTTCLFRIYLCSFFISLPLLLSSIFLFFRSSLLLCVCPTLPAPHSNSNTQAFFWMKMMKNKPLVRSCSVCSARERSYSLREWSCMHLGMLSVTLQREMDYLNLLYHCFIHHVLPFTSYMTLGSNSTSSEKPCTLATSSSLIHCFHSCKKMGSNHMRAQMLSAQPKTKQLCCASSSEVAPNRTALPADGAQRGSLGLGDRDVHWRMGQSCQPAAAAGRLGESHSWRLQARPV